MWPRKQRQNLQEGYQQWGAYAYIQCHLKKNSSSAEQWCQNTLNAPQESQLSCFLTWVSIYLVI